MLDRFWNVLRRYVKIFEFFACFRIFETEFVAKIVGSPDQEIQRIDDCLSWIFLFVFFYRPHHVNHRLILFQYLVLQFQDFQSMDNEVEHFLLPRARDGIFYLFIFW